MGLIWMIFGPLIILGVARVMDWFSVDTSSSAQSPDRSTLRVNECDGDSHHNGTASGSPSSPEPGSSPTSTRGSTHERIWDVAGDPDFDDVSGGAWDATDYGDRGWDGGGWDGGGDPSM